DRTARRATGERRAAPSACRRSASPPSGRGKEDGEPGAAKNRGQRSVGFFFYLPRLRGRSPGRRPWRVRASLSPQVQSAERGAPSRPPPQAGEEKKTDDRGRTTEKENGTSSLPSASSVVCSPAIRAAHR